MNLIHLVHRLLPFPGRLLSIIQIRRPPPPTHTHSHPPFPFLCPLVRVARFLAIIAGLLKTSQEKLRNEVRAGTRSALIN